jgi:branched-chain amino acid transport system ATP-binding protein
MNALLRVENLSVQFGALRAVSDVSLTLLASEVVGLIGANGSGKTTFLNALTGVVAFEGTARVGGVLIRPLRLEPTRRSGLIRVFQAPQMFPGLTVLENVLVAHPDHRFSGLASSLLRRRAMSRTERHRLEVARSALTMVGIERHALDMANSLPYGKQRLVDFARVFASAAKVALLDEPTAGLNDEETEHVGNLVLKLKEAGVSVVLVDHKVSLINQCCDRVVALELGQYIAEGSPAEIWKMPRVVESYLGAPHDA